MLYSAIVGVLAALGALVFSTLVHLLTDLALVDLAGYDVLKPGGEAGGVIGFDLQSALHASRRWLLLLLPAVGGLLSGWIVFGLAPEAEGHGTDAVIRAFHRQHGLIRPRVAAVKTVASAITIGSGGSAGQEGPIAQIGGALGSYLGKLLRLDEADRRMLVVAGVAAGVGSIFQSPLGGAFFAAEVLYREDIESEAIMPAIIASITGYSLYSTAAGSGTVFVVPSFEFVSPLELLPLILLAIVCAVVGITFTRVFYGVRKIFAKPLSIPPHVKPAVGGALVGIIAFFFPAVMGSSYGWLQQAMYGHLTLTVMLLLAGAKILSTSLTIGSGGSGGVFAPSLVIGGMLGGAVGEALHTLLPSIVTQPTAYVMIGMATFFTAVANVPITATIMISEMTGSYTLLVPLIFAAVVAHLLARHWSIYTEQVKNYRESPAHQLDLAPELLSGIRVRSIIQHPVYYHELDPADTLEEIISVFTRTQEVVLPVLGPNNTKSDRYSGLVFLDSIQPYLDTDETTRRLLIARDLEVPLASVRLDDTLDTALTLFQQVEYPELPVLDDQGVIQGFIRPGQVLAEYERALLRKGQGDR